MALNTTGILLEGVRLSVSVNEFVYPPRTLVTDNSTFNSLTDRCEYCLLATGQPDGQSGIYIKIQILNFRGLEMTLLIDSHTITRI